MARNTDGAFRSADEFVEVMDRTFQLMSDDPDTGPRLRGARSPQRFEFPDLDLVVNLRAGGAGEPNLVWSWTDQVEWEPGVHVAMSSTVANRYFQGRERMATAIARRRIRTGGDMRAALEIMATVRHRPERYRALLAAEYPHLAL